MSDSPEFKAAALPRKGVGARMLPLAIIVAGAAFFMAVALDLKFHGKLAQADGVIAPAVFGHADPWLLIVAGGISRTGGADIDVGVALLLSLYLLKQRRPREWRAFWTIVVGLVGSALINQGLKGWFAVPRPARYTFYAFKKSEGPYSFPSGHTMSAALLVGLLVLVWMHLVAMPAWKRAGLWLLTALWTTLAGASLIYVGVHTLTDVLAAFGLSAAWLGVLRLMLPPRAYHGVSSGIERSACEVDGRADSGAV
ncbi:MAG TPA: phosphatase PAP2 family protein [Phycisphaerae bacterium]|nr:phosphatase PAP2 family protein [Phycisphaerae bacterium]